MSAVSPDYFMALRHTEHAYREGVDLLSEVQKNPSRTTSEIHRMLGRRHPHLTARFADTYQSAPISADFDQPHLLFRGEASICCDARLSSESSLRAGLCAEHPSTA